MKNFSSISILVFAAIFCFTQAQGQEKITDKKNKEETVLKVNKNESQKVITVGIGKSRQSAVRDAMVRAVEKVRGVDVFSESQQFRFEGAAADFDRSQTDDTEIKFGAVDVKSSGTVEGFGLGGLIKSYEVLEDTKQDAGAYKVK